MTNPIVSVIIPVYNTSDYLACCIESVLNQVFDRFELVLVNDGSTDTSGQICDEYAIIDERVDVIHQPNSGVSSARNAGLVKASGKYIVFVDSDDFCDPEMLGELVVAIEENHADFCVAGYAYYYDNGRREDQILSAGGTFSMTSFVKTHFEESFQKNILSGPCCKLFRKDIIIDCNLQFRSEFSVGEDGIFSYNYLQSCKTIAIVPSVLYFYRQREKETHLMSIYHPNAFEAIYHYYMSLKSFLDNNNSFEENKRTVHEVFLSRLLYCMGQLYNESAMNRINTYEELNKLIAAPFFQMLLRKSNKKRICSKEELLIRLIRLKQYRIIDFYWRRKRSRKMRAQQVRGYCDKYRL